MTDDVHRTEWKSKPCDICGESEDLTELGSREYHNATRDGKFEFQHSDVVCEQCGFVFSASVPPESFLARYYSSAHLSDSDYTTIEPDYDTEQRLDVIKTHVPVDASIAEVGAGDGAFAGELEQKGYGVKSIEPSTSGEDEFVGRNRGSQDDTFDAVVSYNVLEHVVDSRVWVRRIKELLGSTGYCIIEIPDFETSPQSSLSSEHFLHFSKIHLQELMASMGFETRQISNEQASRPNEIVGVFKLCTVDKDTYVTPTSETWSEVVERSKSTYFSAIDERETERERRRALAMAIQRAAADLNSGLLTYFWAANDYATGIAKHITPDNQLRVRLVDNAESKVATSHPGFTEPIQAPDFEQSRNEHRLFVLCSPNWNDDIRDQIEEQGLEDITILDGFEWSRGDEIPLTDP